MKKNKKKGFGSFEFLIVSLVCLGLSGLLLSIAFQTQEQERYRVFAYDVKVLGMNATHYQGLENEKTIYMLELMNAGFVTMMKNPFNGKDTCDPLESKVLFQGGDKKVSLRCGDFLIQEHTLKDDNYLIYQVSPWKEKRENKKQIKRTFYNYQKKEKVQFSSFLEEDLFLHLFNEKEKTEYKKVLDIPENYKILKRTLYRDEKQVKKLKY